MNEVYKALGSAIKKRDHAVAMLKRWQAALAAAEEDIAKLSNELSTIRTVADADFQALVEDGQSYEQIDTNTE